MLFSLYNRIFSSPKRGYRIFPTFTINISRTRQELSMPQIWPVLMAHTNQQHNPILTPCFGVNGGCLPELRGMTPHVSSRYKYQSSDDKRCSGGKLKGLCFCVRADNSLQTYLVLHQNVRVNLFQRQKNAMIKLLPSATEARHSGG